MKEVEINVKIDINPSNRDNCKDERQILQYLFNYNIAGLNDLVKDFAILLLICQYRPGG